MRWKYIGAMIALGSFCSQSFAIKPGLDRQDILQIRDEKVQELQFLEVERHVLIRAMNTYSTRPVYFAWKGYQLELGRKSLRSIDMEMAQLKGLIGVCESDLLISHQ